MILLEQTDFFLVCIMYALCIKYSLVTLVTRSFIITIVDSAISTSEKKIRSNLSTGGKVLLKAIKP